MSDCNKKDEIDIKLVRQDFDTVHIGLLMMLGATKNMHKSACEMSFKHIAAACEHQADQVTSVLKLFQEKADILAAEEAKQKALEERECGG